MKVVTWIFGILIAAQIIAASKSDGKEIEYKRGVIHSGSLYLQGRSEPDRGCHLLRINLDNPARVERIKFRVSESDRVSSLMKISGSDIYLSSITDSGGGQIVAEIDKYTLDDFVVTSSGHLIPSVDKFSSSIVSHKKQVITTGPLTDALTLSTKRSGRDMTPEQVRLQTPVKLKLWYDFVVGDDGYLYLYILEENKLTVWKRDKLTIEEWQKHYTTEEIAPGPFSVTSESGLTYISSASGKVYQLSGGNLIRVADSSAPQPGATAGADSEGRTVLFIENLDAGENWSVTVDKSFNVAAKANYMKSGTFEVTALPGDLANALRQILQATKGQ